MADSLALIITVLLVSFGGDDSITRRAVKELTAQTVESKKQRK